MPKYVLIALFALLVFFSHRPVKEALLGLQAVARADAMVSCEHEGRTYPEGEQRQAEDGCNVCTCEAPDWTCTQIACAAGTRTATIRGSLIAPEGEEISSQRVCALDVQEPGREYCRQTVHGATAYALKVEPGTYWVYATRAGDAHGKRAYWSNHVTCTVAGKETCKDHSPRTVTVKAGETRSADPHDWSARVQIDDVTITPSKREYGAHAYYSESVFLVKSRGLSSVTLMASAYPPEKRERFASIGVAELVGEEHGLQTWALPVAKGFQATSAYAVGKNADGEYVQSTALRFIRPIGTAHAK